MTNTEATIIQKVMKKMQEISGNDDYECKILNVYTATGMYDRTTSAVQITSLMLLVQALLTYPEIVSENRDAKDISEFNWEELGKSIVVF